MKMSTRARYGARAMAELAAVYPHRSVSVKELAQNQRLSAKYLEQIMATLKASGLVKAERGLHGGYVLCASPEQVTLYDVVQALEGGPALVECVAHPDVCPMHANCSTRDTWVELNDAVTGVLKGTTLKDLAERKAAKNSLATSAYEI